MAFSDTQTRQLKAKLDSQFVKTRKANGTTLHYIEGWHAIAEANRIFGYDAWDRRTIATRCVWTGMSGQDYLAAYIAKVRIRVRAGDVIVVREGSGTGEGKASTPGAAHEIALKSAETDATKRALATFGNSFGLALYDREQAGVRHRPHANTATEQVAKGPWILRSATGASKGTFAELGRFDTALRSTMTDAQNIEVLFAIWEQNIATVRALSHALKQARSANSDFAQGLVAHLKACAVALVKPSDEAPTTHGKTVNARMGSSARVETRRKIDKSELVISEVKRLRSKEHLRYVARQPCVICGRTPSHAHHIRYAQPKGLALKVSDEFTVPLCAIHHSQNHTTGDEKRWWEEHKIDPFPIAEGLWKHSQSPRNG
jgi:DNA recombination protein Rad52